MLTALSSRSNGQQQGGILALLAAGSLLLAGCTSAPTPPTASDPARPDCRDWNTIEFFEQATTADVGRCLSKGADPNAGDDRGFTPLHWAASDSNPKGVEVVKALLAAGADPNARDDSFSRTPLHRAGRYSDDAEVVKALLAAGADPNAGDYRGKTPLHGAAAASNPEVPEVVEVVKALLAAGADPNAGDNLGMTPLHGAAGAIIPDPEVVKALLAAGADPSQWASSGSNRGPAHLLPVDLIRESSPLWGTDAHRLLEAGRER